MKRVVVMKKKVVLYEEVAYLIGILLLALGTAFSEKANFGMSMVVAPAYLIHLKVSQYLPWFSFGVAEYTFQAVLLIALTLTMRKFKKGYLFSFATAVFYGIVLDLWVKAVSFIPSDTYAVRTVLFVFGMLCCSLGVAFLFNTYIAPEAYELIVKEVSSKYSFKISRVKTIYDCISCVVGIILSFTFFGMFKFVGVSYGTVICALCNGFLIGKFSGLIEKTTESKRLI